MRYLHGISIVISYLDPNEERCAARMRFNGNVDHRRVRRMIRRELNRMGINAHKHYLNDLIRARSFINDAA